MNITATRRNVNRYTDGSTLATVPLTDEQFAAYLAAGQEPEGLVRVADLPADVRDMLPADCDGGTVVYID